MNPLCSARHVPFVPVRVTGGAFVVHRYSYAAPNCSTSQYRRRFIPNSVFSWNKLGDTVSMVWDFLVFKSSVNARYFRDDFFNFSSFLLWVGFVGLGSSYWYGESTLSQPCNADFVKVRIIITLKRHYNAILLHHCCTTAAPLLHHCCSNAVPLLQPYSSVGHSCSSRVEVETKEQHCFMLFLSPETERNCVNFILNS